MTSNPQLLDVLIYNYQSADGYTIFIENLTNKRYEETIFFSEVENLKWSNMQNEITIFVEPFNNYILRMEVIDKSKPFTYKQTSKYRIYQ